MSSPAEKPSFKTISVGKGNKEVKYNAEWLRSVSEREARKKHNTRDKNQVTNVWKQSNGLSKRTYRTEQDEEETKPEETPVNVKD